ncbi:dihydrofolate reductase family protein [Ectothiorhodospiraceae bacterium 2226]|nr:dihydrofolate reductase family protein [Ectothiorhodospiraceae bacterium 2226]
MHKQLQAEESFAPVDDVLRLYPLPSVTRPLRGLYLDHALHRLGSATRPFVYTNFILSADGRIYHRDPHSGRREVPPTLANARDWRLYQELAAQADVVLTTARHLRAVAAGRHIGLLGVDEAQHVDLAAWRAAHGLPRHPAVAVISRELDIPADALRAHYPGPLVVVTARAADARRAGALQAAGIRVLRAGRKNVEGAALRRALGEAGFRRIYSIAGARVLHTLLAGDSVDRLYLTQAQVLIGGERFGTLTTGPTLHPARGFRLHALYLDRGTPAGADQLFVCLARDAHAPAAD